MIKEIFKIKIIILGLITVLILLLLSGCTGISYIPGASYGYYIWEEDGSIFIEWSSDKSDAEFDGVISTDGKITKYMLEELEEEDAIEVSEDGIEFSATLSSADYSDGFSFTLQNYTYLEFDLKINDAYELSRINLGGFLENPESDVFRIGKDYFKQLEMKPWYQKHPFSEFFYKLFSNKYFTFLYLFILGVIIIEILRVTVIARRKRKVIWLGTSYVALIMIEVLIYFVLKIFTN
jgi:hypothetical protein